MTNSLKKVCIIGAGSSGITAAKAFKEAGIDFDCFEKGSGIGGIWRYNNDNGMSSAYRSLHIVSSKWNMQYSDFPMPDDFPDYGHHSDVLKYFEDYVDHFNIRDTITFNTEVVDIAPGLANTWNVRLDNGETRRYQAIVVANGHHWSPRFPNFSGEFDGPIIHSHYYKIPDNYKDKRVLIVGIGNSACDIAVDLSRLAKSVHISTRRSAYVLPKYFLAIPNDQWLKPSLDYLPFGLRRRLFSALAYLAVGNQEKYGLPRPKHKLLHEHPTLNQEFLSYVGHGRIKIKPNIEKLAGEAVEFIDGSRENFDAIIYATGYNIDFPFIQSDVFSVKDNKVDLFRQVVHPDLPGLYFLALIQPLGAVMPLAELQAKWISGILTDEMVLPPVTEMKKTIANYRRKLEKRYVNSPRHTIQVDFFDYIRQIKKEMRKGRRRAKRSTTIEKEVASAY